ncbi:lysoplasmalogenase family protein [Robertkochia solimangrovi]|uniref:lysoplasmalogenase family protein n=1 Tax=Robertkochia solimangrovi TaxID=2213046 RepID=UPI00117F29B1|nr:lysoplasmalogenase family protein [Robertkochia solimangrovi]TRZ41069.1 hypothetical protein DMZ48_18250 [Robertkochia solimangrovi]
MKSKQGWIVYFIFALFYLICEIFESDILIHIARMLLMPVVFVEYMRTHKKRHPFPIIIISACFLGDLAVALAYRSLAPVSLACFAISHLVFIYICFRAIRDLNVKKLLFSALPVIILWFIYYNYSIKDIFGKDLGDNYIYVLLYSIVLSAFMIISLMGYFNDENKMSLFAVIIALSFVVGDIMMGLYAYITPLRFFELTYATAGVVGYFFIMRFNNEFNFKQIY